MKKGVLSFILGVTMIWRLSAQSTDHNYIRTLTPRTAIREITNPTSSSVLRSRIHYFDGLGRPIQTVESGISPLGADWVAMQEYDSMGRLSKEWIPVPIPDGLGEYRSPEQIRSASQTFHSDLYDYSPLNRPIKQIGAGEAWRKNGNGNHISTKTKQIEFSHMKTGKEGDKGLNFVSSSHEQS